MPLRYGGCPAGELRDRFTFYSVPTVQGGRGAKRGEPVEQFTIYGSLIPKFGGEQVMAARLTSIQPYTLTIRQNSMSRQIGTDWYFLKKGSSTKYNIRTITDPDQRRQWFEILADSGGAA